MLDEKVTKEQAYDNLELIAGFLSIPIILLSANKTLASRMAGSWKTDNHPIYLSKPCLIADLQATMENLLEMTLEVG